MVEDYFEVLVEDYFDVLMDDFSIFGDSFEAFLTNLGAVLECRQQKNLLQSWKQFHFMLRKGIVLGYIVSSNGIEVRQSES